jgi:hypothetical protein
MKKGKVRVERHTYCNVRQKKLEGLERYNKDIEGEDESGEPYCNV